MRFICTSDHCVVNCPSHCTTGLFPSQCKATGLENTRYTNSRIRERRRRENLCSFNEPKRGFNPSDVSTLRQYLMHVLSVIKWQRVYRLRPRCRPPTQIIAFNSLPHPPWTPLRQPSSPAGYHRPSADAATVFQGGLATHNVLFISSAPLSRRAFSPGIFIASRTTLPFRKFNTRTP